MDCRRRERVVPVVPRLAERRDRQQPEVAALVASAERLLAEEVADRVDREGHVLEQEDPDEAGPDHRLEASLPACSDEVAGEEREPERECDPEQVETIDPSYESVFVQVATVLD